MTQRMLFKMVGVVLLVGLCVPVGTLPLAAHPPRDATPVGSDLIDPKYLNKNSCPDDPKNLLANGGFFGETHDTPYGPVVSGWEPFIFSGAPPQFRWVNNEGIFKGQSQQIFSSNAFDAGILQTVRNLQPNAYYWFRLGWAPAAKSFGGPNEAHPSVGVQVGYDPFGGTDPKSSNVTWGGAWFGDKTGLNRPQLTLVFPARASNVTIFLRAIAKDGSGGENRVWLNAACMEPRPELGTAAPLAPTATPIPPSATPRPPTRAPTKVAQAPSATPTAPAPPTATPTSKPSPMPTITMTPRYARPDVTPVPTSPLSLNADTLTGLGTLSVIGAFIFWGIGLVLWRGLR